MAPFMSDAPRPYKLPSSTSPENGPEPIPDLALFRGDWHDIGVRRPDQRAPAARTLASGDHIGSVATTS